MSTELDKGVLATMTPEELEAISAEASPEELLVMRQHALALADEDESEDESEDEEAGKDGGSEAPTEEPAEEPAEEGFAPSPKPTYQSQLPDDFDASLKGLSEQEAALWEEFDTGEIERPELQAQLRALESERAALNKAQIKAEISAEMSEQTSAQEWAWNVKRFIAAVAKDEKIDYNKDADKQADLDLFVRALGADPRNSEKQMEWFLQEAHRLVKAKNGIATTQPTVKEAAVARKSPVGDLPKSLAQVPGGEGPGDLGGEFVNLDKLSGMELENALAKMTPDQRERYSLGL